MYIIDTVTKLTYCVYVILIAGVNIGAVFSETISTAVIKFYSLPFRANGITLNVTVTSGYVYCYASDRFRNPNQYMYDWIINVNNYWEVYLNPSLLSRPQGSILYVSFYGVDSSNVYLAQTHLGNALTDGEFSSRSWGSMTLYVTLLRFAISLSSYSLHSLGRSVFFYLLMISLFMILSQSLHHLMTFKLVLFHQRELR